MSPRSLDAQSVWVSIHGSSPSLEPTVAVDTNLLADLMPVLHDSRRGINDRAIHIEQQRREVLCLCGRREVMAFVVRHLDLPIELSAVLEVS